jgi:predicted AAA+ superfamily ATPase
MMNILQDASLAFPHGEIYDLREALSRIRIEGLYMDEAELFKKAEAHAIRRSGRSPRVAKQFIELLKVGL